MAETIRGSNLDKLKLAFVAKRRVFPKEVILHYVQEYITKDGYKYSADGEWVNFSSVFASDDKRHCGINFKNNFVKDYKLDQGWSFTQFVAEHQGLSNEGEGRLFVAEIAFKLKKLPFKGDDRPDRVVEAVALSELEKVPDMKDFGADMDWLGKKALNYLYARGIRGKHIKRYGLKYSGAKKCPACAGSGYDDDEPCEMCNGRTFNPFYARIIIPTYENGKLVYLQGRSLNEEDELRYMNPKSPRLQVVYFHDLLKEGEDVYVTEGPFDAMTLYDYNATCLMNMRFEDPKILKVAARKPRRIIFVPQWDETEEKRARARRALDHNVERTMFLAKGIPVGILHWYEKLPKDGRPKDVNQAQVTEVDQSQVEIVQAKKMSQRSISRRMDDDDTPSVQSETATRGKKREALTRAALDGMWKK